MINWDRFQLYLKYIVKRVEEYYIPKKGSLRELISNSYTHERLADFYFSIMIIMNVATIHRLATLLGVRSALFSGLFLALGVFFLVYIGSLTGELHLVESRKLEGIDKKYRKSFTKGIIIYTILSPILLIIAFVI